MDTAFLKELYFRELDRRQQLDSAPTLRIAVLALVGGVFSSYFRSFDLDSSFLTWVFLLSAAGALTLSVLTVIWIVRAFVGFVWEYLPYPDELGKFYDSLQSYQETHGLQAEAANDMFEEDLKLRLRRATTTNAYNNNVRSELIYGASRFLAGAVICTLLGGLPVVVRTGDQILDSVRNGDSGVPVGQVEGETDE